MQRVKKQPQPRDYSEDGAAIWDHEQGCWVHLDAKEIDRRWPAVKAAEKRTA